MSWFEVISEFLIRKKWEIMVSEDFRVLRDVPKKYITQSMCENTFERNYFMLRDVPKEYRTQEMCLKAFEKYASLEYVPEQYITREMGLKAVKRDFTESIFLPQKYFDDAEFVELRRCKGSKGDDDECYPDVDKDIECLLDKCCICKKVVCPWHRSSCNTCRDFEETRCKDCIEEYTSLVLCSDHIRPPYYVTVPLS